MAIFGRWICILCVQFERKSLISCCCLPPRTYFGDEAWYVCWTPFCLYSRSINFKDGVEQQCVPVRSHLFMASSLLPLRMPVIESVTHTLRPFAGGRRRRVSGRVKARLTCSTSGERHLPTAGCLLFFACESTAASQWCLTFKELPVRCALCDRFCLLIIRGEYVPPCAGGQRPICVADTKWLWSPDSISSFSQTASRWHLHALSESYKEKSDLVDMTTCTVESLCCLFLPLNRLH